MGRSSPPVFDEIGNEDDDDHDASPPPPSSSSSSSSSSSLKAFLSGGVGGACSVLIGHPLDLVKVRMQTTTAPSATTVSGMLAETIRKEGPRGLFRGVGAPLASVVPVTAVAFWGYDVGRRIVASSSYSSPRGGEGGDPRRRALDDATDACVAGAMSALPTALVIAPTERVKCLLQVQQQQRQRQRRRGGTSGMASSVGVRAEYYSGTIDCARRLVEEGGARSLFRGTGMTIVRGVPGTAAYFAAYEYAKREITVYRGMDPDDGSPPSPGAVLVAGGLAGVAYWAVGVPIVADVLKSRYQTSPPGRYPGGYVDVYSALVREEGYAGLFRGLRPAMMRAIPASMARSIGMEVTRKMLEFAD